MSKFKTAVIKFKQTSNKLRIRKAISRKNHFEKCFYHAPLNPQQVKAFTKEFKENTEKRKASKEYIQIFIEDISASLSRAKQVYRNRKFLDFRIFSFGVDNLKPAQELVAFVKSSDYIYDSFFRRMYAYFKLLRSAKKYLRRAEEHFSVFESNANSILSDRSTSKDKYRAYSRKLDELSDLKEEINSLRSEILELRKKLLFI